MRLGKMLVFTGLLIAVVVGLSLPALATSPATITVEGQADIWDHLFIFLTNDIVRTVLLIIGIAGVVIEIATVGSFGAFGTIGILLLFCILWVVSGRGVWVLAQLYY